MNKEDKHIDSGFKVPEDYFEDLTHTLDNLRLSNKHEAAGFNVPKGYFEECSFAFDDLNNESFLKLKVRQLSRPKIITVSMLAIAACLAMMFNLKNSSQPIDFMDLEQETLAEFIIQDQAWYDFEPMEQVLEEDSITTKNENFLLDDELQQYLIDESSLFEIYMQ
ncbi:MAG: hypothetical protein WBA16_00285 [Nonlabens sp.]